jgi:uncharacterized lipoprotein YajG
MKKYLCLLAVTALFAACEKKETNVTNPPAENNTTIVKESPAPVTKTETNTTINTTTSPAPSP